MNLHVFQHDECEGPGAIADWAADHGHSISTTHLCLGDYLPDPEIVDLLVVMGGPMNIYQDRDYPWLKAERAFIENYVKSGKAAAGICLGSQFLADALGGRVIQNPYVEIGWFPIEFTAEARVRLPFLPLSLEVMHWHGDTFELPAEALRLASSAGCANQGFLYDDRILALQFHPEMKRDGLSDLVMKLGNELKPAKFVYTGGNILAATDAKLAEGNALLHKLLDAISPRG